MGTPLRRSWPVTLPAVPGAGLLVLATVIGFIVVTAVPAAGGRLALTLSELTARPWTALSYPFVQAGPLPLVLNLAALVLLAAGLERGAGGLRLLVWFGAGTLAGTALALLQPAAPMLGSGPALIGVALGLASERVDDAARGRWLGTALAVGALLPGVTPSPDGTIRGALIGGLLATLVMGRSKQPPVVERRIELPNSHYNPPGVHHEVQLTTPWDVIDVTALHEANRAGVELLLQRARELGPTHLSPADRELLDRMATAARLTAERAGAGRGDR